jgi:hypothetical protein
MVLPADLSAGFKNMIRGGQSAGRMTNNSTYNI